MLLLSFSKVYHHCSECGHETFLCPNGTVFNQQNLVCDWWFSVRCGESSQFFPKAPATTEASPTLVVETRRDSREPIDEEVAPAQSRKSATSSVTSYTTRPVEDSSSSSFTTTTTTRAERRQRNNRRPQYQDRA